MKKIKINVGKKFNSKYNKFHNINNGNKYKFLLKIKSIFNNDVMIILVVFND